MPVGIVARGGSAHQQNVGNLTVTEATKALQDIKTHLSQPGRAAGVFTLVNRTRDGAEMQLVRKNRFQLMFHGEGNARLNDTKAALDTLLRRAGLPDAADKLQTYLAGKGNESNRVSARQMLALLNAHLPERPLAAESESVVPDIDDFDENGNLKQNSSVADSLLQRDSSAVVDVMQPVAAQVGPGVNQPANQPVSEQDDPPAQAVPLEVAAPVHAPKATASSFGALLNTAGVTRDKLLGQGGFGKAELVTVAGDPNPLVLKTFYDGGVQVTAPLTRNRNADFNEGIAAYLTSKKSPDYASSVNVAQPRYFLVKVGENSHRMVDPLALRALLKSEPGGNVKCTGLIMPKAAGGEAFELVVNDQLTGSQKKQLIKSTLQSLKKLNERGFVHRDIKLENVYFDPSSGNATLIDTGMLHKTSKHKPDTRFITTRVGTPDYMHPRALRGSPHGTETDLYATAMMALLLEHGGNASRVIGSMTKLGTRADFDAVALQVAVRRELTRSPTSQGLRALDQSLNDGKSLTSFAAKCLKLANEPAARWADRDEAQRMYAELLADPRLS